MTIDIRVLTKTTKVMIINDWIKSTWLKLFLEDDICIIKDNQNEEIVNDNDLEKISSYVFIAKLNEELILKFWIKILKRWKKFFLENLFNKKEKEILIPGDKKEILKAINYIL